ncbi:hypothetical protein JHK86_055703 [Glycine max]|nr:hypothetical protein JHK86_055703 [Glycine max]
MERKVVSDGGLCGEEAMRRGGLAGGCLQREEKRREGEASNLKGQATERVIDNISPLLYSSTTAREQWHTQHLSHKFRLHPMLSMDSASIDNSSSSNIVVYDGYGGGGGYNVIPMGTTTTVVASDGDQNPRSNHGFGDNEIKALGYESVYGSTTDPYHAHAMNLYYLTQQQPSSVDAVKASAYDQGSACNTWVPTAIPTHAPRSSTSMALCHGATPFSLLHE